MMGTHDTQGSLFYVGLDLEDRIPADHPLRLIRQKIDFSFVRQEVADFYGHNGHVSVDPEVIVKLLLLLFLGVYGDFVYGLRKQQRRLGMDIVTSLASSSENGNDTCG